MRYEVRKSLINVVGQVWSGYKGTYTYELDNRDICNILCDGTDAEQIVDREAVDHWLSLNAGDFQSITDFYASLEVGDETIDIPWADEDNEMFYYQCVGEY